MRWPLVQVLWVDSADPGSNWVSVEQLSDYPNGSLDCVSIGWLISEGSESITLASHITDPEEEASEACGILTIPKLAILAARELEKATSASLRDGFSVAPCGSFSVPPFSSFCEAFSTARAVKNPRRRADRRRPVSHR